MTKNWYPLVNNGKFGRNRGRFGEKVDPCYGDFRESGPLLWGFLLKSGPLLWGFCRKSTLASRTHVYTKHSKCPPRGIGSGHFR